MVCSLIGSSFTGLGCSSEVGTAPPSEKPSSPFTETETIGTPGQKGSAPKSIKGKILSKKAGSP
jgi:hypothetical protein